MKKKITIIVAIICILCIVSVSIILAVCLKKDDATPNGNGSGNGITSGNSSGDLSSGELESGNLPSGETSSGDIGSGDSEAGLPGDTIIIDENGLPPKYDFDDDNIDYSQAIVIEDNTLTGVTEYGKTLPRIVIPDGVTSINCGFGENINLISVEIPDSVTSIGEAAFAFCVSLSDIKLPSGLKSIGKSAFAFCISLTKLNLPSSVISIGEGAFESCSNLVIEYADSQIQEDLKNNLYINYSDDENKCFAPIVYNCDNNDIADDGFIYAVAQNGLLYSLKDGIAKVSGHSYLSGDISIANNVIYKDKQYQVTEIGDFALFYAIDMSNINLPSSIKSIGNNAFSACPSLKSIVIPSNITSIGELVFAECDLTIYCEVKSKPSGWNINWNSDDRNESKKQVVWDCKNNEIADDGNIYYVADNGIRYALKDGVARVVKQSMNLSGLIILPNQVTYKGIKYDVTEIVDNAFEGCIKLTGIEILNGVTRIGNYSFSECRALTSIKMPNSITSIGNYAFSGCRALTSIKLPNSVTSIDSYAFSECSALESIVIPKSVTSMGSFVFNYCNSLIIYCEVESKPSGWNMMWNLLSVQYQALPVTWNYVDSMAN